jgi:hypothetical protein
MTHAHRVFDRAAHLPISSMAPTSFLAKIAQDVLLSLVLTSGVVAVSDHRVHLVPIAIVASIAILVRWTG